MANPDPNIEIQSRWLPVLLRGHKSESSAHGTRWPGLRTSIGIVMGALVGVAIIYLPMLIQQATVPNLTVLGGERQDPASADGEGVAEDAVPGERLPILVAMAGLGVGIAYATYHLARERKA